MVADSHEHFVHSVDCSACAGGFFASNLVSRHLRLWLSNTCVPNLSLRSFSHKDLTKLTKGLSEVSLLCSFGVPVFFRSAIRLGFQEKHHSGACRDTCGRSALGKATSPDVPCDFWSGAWRRCLDAALVHSDYCPWRSTIDTVSSGLELGLCLSEVNHFHFLLPGYDLDHARSRSRWVQLFSSNFSKAFLPQ